MGSIQIYMFETTGRRIVRDDVAAPLLAQAAAMLSDALAGDAVVFPNEPSYALQVTPLGQCLLARIGPPENFTVAFGVAAREACGAKLWISLSAMPRKVLPPLRRLPMPAVPWCAAVDLSGPEEFAQPKTEGVKGIIVGVSLAWMDLQGWPGEAD